MMLPAQNRKDVKDLPQEVKDGLEILHVRYVASLLHLSSCCNMTIRVTRQPLVHFLTIRAILILHRLATSGKRYDLSGPIRHGRVMTTMPGSRVGFRSKHSFVTCFISPAFQRVRDCHQMSTRGRDIYVAVTRDSGCVTHMVFGE